MVEKFYFYNFLFSFLFSHLLQQQDAQVLQVCLDALHNILKQTPEDKLELVTTEIEECGGKKNQNSIYIFLINLLIKVWIKSRIYKHIQIAISINNLMK